MNGIVAAYIDEFRNVEEERSKGRYRIDDDKLVRQLRDIAFLDIGKLFDGDGNLLEPSQMDEEARRAITSFTAITNQRSGDDSESRTFKVKLADRMSAIDKSAKHIGYYDADNAQQDLEEQKGEILDFIMEIIKPPVTREDFPKKRQ
ncbi:MAG: terminase small subunit [Deltaproteobacteria bacterium]|nr:terminase small subunit [Deltaproteobacteria bacterium]